MPERARVFAVTGDDVVGFTVDGSGACDAESLLEGVGAGCVAVDPDDPRRAYGESWTRLALQLPDVAGLAAAPA